MDITNIIFKDFEILVETYALVATVVDHILPNDNIGEDLRVKLEDDLWMIKSNSHKSFVADEDKINSIIGWLDYLLAKGVIWVPLNSSIDTVKGLYTHVCLLYEWLVRNEKHDIDIRDTLMTHMDEVNEYWSDLSIDDPVLLQPYIMIESCFQNATHCIRLTLDRGLFDFGLDANDVDIRLLDITDILPSNDNVFNSIKNLSINDVDVFRS